MNKRFFIELAPLAKKQIKQLVALLAGLVFASSANATIIFDDPVEGESWTLSVSGGPLADLWRIDWVSGQLFELPTITSTTPGWSTAWATTTSGAVSGPAASPITLWYFADTPADLFEVNLAIYNTDVLQLAIRVFQRGAGIGTELLVDWDPGTASPVPEPATLTLMGIGLAGLAWMRRRKRLAA